MVTLMRDLYMKETACVWYRDGKYTNLVPDGAFFCLPCSDDEHVQHIEVHEGRVKSEAAMNESARADHAHRAK